MDIKDLRVFLIAMFALILLTMRTDARTNFPRTRAILDKPETSHSFNSSTLYNYKTLIPSSPHDDDPLIPILTLSTDTDDSLYGDNSADDSRNDYRTEIDEEHPSTPKESEKTTDYDAATEDCDCRCGEGEQGVAPGEACPADKGTLDPRPTVYSGANGDCPDVDPDSSTATSMSISSSAGLVACILLSFAL